MRVSSFLRALRAGADRLNLQDRRLLVAVSGGPDSVALLVGLRELAGPLGIALEAATIDHGLRTESGDDCRYVARLCRRLGVRCTVSAVKVGRAGGTEAAARRARYAALRSIAEARGCELIATGHTLDDQAETVLLRLARGAGTRGLRGILPRRGGVVRPMLRVSRSQVNAFLKARRLSPRTDPTNLSADFDRNRLRAMVVPALERALGPGAVRALARAAEVAQADERYLEARTRALAGSLLSRVAGGLEGDSRALRRVPEALRRRLLRRAARVLGLRLTALHIEQIERALVSSGPARVGLPRAHVFEVAYGRFAMRLPKRTKATAGFAYPIDGPGTVTAGRCVVEVKAVWGAGAAEPGTIRLAPERLALPLWLRSRRPGDRFRPRAGHEKKLKAFLIDRKVPREERDGLALLCDDSGRVLWIVGQAASEAAAEGERAESAWQIRVQASDPGARALDTRKGPAEDARPRAGRAK